MSSRTSLRSPMWFSAGAVSSVLVTLVAMQAWNATAAVAPTESAYVAIAPCRLLDTRPAPDNVGSRSTPVGVAEEFDVQVTGTHGACTIPSSATAVAVNLTAANATSATYVAVYPADVANPGTSAVNITPGQSPTPNSVDVQLGAGGVITVFNAHGTVDVIADVLGYYSREGLVAAGAAVNQLGNRIEALEADAAVPGPHTFEWTFSGTITDEQPLMSTMVIPEGATVTPLGGEMTITSLDPDCTDAYFVSIRGGGLPTGGFRAFQNASFDGAGIVQAIDSEPPFFNDSGAAEPLIASGGCLTVVNQQAVDVLDFSYAVSGRFVFRLDDEAAPFD